MNDIAIVIAAYNEADNIGEVVRQARRHGRVIVVDDASTDPTAALAHEAGAEVVRHDTNTHIKQAFVDGFRHGLATGAKTLVQMDAGLSHDAEEIPRLVAALADADLVIGSRAVAGGQLVNQPLSRRALSWGGSVLVRAATGLPVRDLTSGFKAWRGSVLETLDRRGLLDQLRARTFAFQFEMTSHVQRLGYRITEVPITYRATGSSLNKRVILEALRIWGGMFWDQRLAWRGWIPTGLVRRARRRRGLTAARRELRRGAHRRPLRIEVGASGHADTGWIPTEAAFLDLLEPRHWSEQLERNSVDGMLAEHVWEHLTVEQGRRAARQCFEYLRPGGRLRVAVPDGLHPDPRYRAAVRPGGEGTGADDHKVLYTYRTLQDLFAKCGFDVTLLEYFDEDGVFHRTDWCVADGCVRRSAKLDRRNQGGQLNYTSIILDAVRPAHPVDAPADLDAVDPRPRREEDAVAAVS